MSGIKSFKGKGRPCEEAWKGQENWNAGKVWKIRKVSRVLSFIKQLGSLSPDETFVGDVVNTSQYTSKMTAVLVDG